MLYDRALCWFRRDLRIEDQAALYYALKQAQQVYCLFVFDQNILNALVDKADRRVEFIWHSVFELKQRLQALGSDLLVRVGDPVVEITQLAQQLQVQALFCNRDYEPAARLRDQQVAQQLKADQVQFHTSKDQVIFETDEILTAAGTVFSVFTPYKKAWLRQLDAFAVKAYPTNNYLNRLAILAAEPMPSLASLNFEATNVLALAIQPGSNGAQARWSEFLRRIDHYQQRRDFPGQKGPSYLSVHLRFGTISIRQLVLAAWQACDRGSAGAETWLSELIWREFYQMLLWHRPDLVNQCFKAEYQDLQFPGNPAHFDLWCQGQTGYPLVDAGMRQLQQTGYMHNRLRMVVASFLVKDLLLDWRWGEAWFARQLLDFDLAANNGGWQWSASTGCDAQPYFRIFNPVSQSQKFDADGQFIRRYVPELAQLNPQQIHAPWLLSAAERQRLGLVLGRDYPQPLVDHAHSRLVALDLFKQAKTLAQIAPSPKDE